MRFNDEDGQEEKRKEEPLPEQEDESLPAAILMPMMEMFAVVCPSFSGLSVYLCFLLILLMSIVSDWETDCSSSHRWRMRREDEEKEREKRKRDVSLLLYLNLQVVCLSLDVCLSFSCLFLMVSPLSFVSLCLSSWNTPAVNDNVTSGADRKASTTVGNNRLTL